MARASHSREPVAGPGRLTIDAVVDSALAIIADRGIEGLSMRILGAAVGVEAMSLYHWFPAKDRLLDAIADRLIGKVRLPPTPVAAQWQSWMTTVARAYRRMGLDHPRAFPLVGARRFLSPRAVVFAQAIIAANLAAGFDIRQSVRVTRAVGAYINGIVLAETSGPATGNLADGEPTGELLSSQQWNEALAIFRRPAFDGTFEFGLTSLLDGALSQRRRRKRNSK